MSTEVRIVPNKASFDRFQYALNEFRMATGITMRDSFIREAGYCCYEFMRYSPPMPKGGGKGLTGQAKKAGENAVAADIHSVFVSKDDPASAFKMMGDAVLRNDVGAFTRWKNVLKKQYAETEYHRRGFSPRGILLAIVQSNNTGHLSDFQAFKNRFGGSATQQTANLPQPISDPRSVHRQLLSAAHGRDIRKKAALTQTKYLVDSARLASFVKEKQRKVGYLKAGWANTLLALPKPKDYGPDVQFASTSKVPKWIMRNLGPRGYANFSGNEGNGNFNLTIGNRVGDNDGVATQASTMGYVLSVRANKLDKEVMRRLGKYIRAFNAQN